MGTDTGLDMGVFWGIYVMWGIWDLWDIWVLHMGVVIYFLWGTSLCSCWEWLQEQ